MGKKHANKAARSAGRTQRLSLDRPPGPPRADGVSGPASAKNGKKAAKTDKRKSGKARKKRIPPHPVGSPLGPEAAGLPALRGGMIRVKAQVAVVHRGRVLMTDGRDRDADTYYWILPGGGVEFGESAQAAAVREIREEMGVELKNLKLLGVFENIFVWQKHRGHEIVYVYTAEFVDAELYGHNRFDGLESGGDRFSLRWVPVSSLVAPNAIPLYPPGLAERLAKAGYI